MKKTESSTGIAILGAQGRARAWIEAIVESPDLHVAGYWDPDPALAADLARTIHDAPVFEDLNSLFHQEDILAAEVNLSPENAVEAAGRCLEYGITVGLRSTAIRSREDVHSLLSMRKGKTGIRLFAPAFYFGPVNCARKALDKKILGDTQTLRIRSVLGRSSRSDDVLVESSFESPADFCGPEFEAMPLIFLLGDVKSVHVYENQSAKIITWVSDRTPGGCRFGVYEAVRSAEQIVRGRLDPLDESFELAGTDGYILACGLNGYIADRPKYATYIRGEYKASLAAVDDDPVQCYRDAVADLADLAHSRVRKTDSLNWMNILGNLRDALRLSVEESREVYLDELGE